jgi:hypothetical protein
LPLDGVESSPGKTPLVPNGQTTDAELALRTYYNYARAYAVAIEGGPNDWEQGVLDRNASQRLTPTAEISDAGVYALQRGLMSLAAAESVDLEDVPELARAAIFWLPVQSYYAVHGVGYALLDAIDDGVPPAQHARFLRTIATKVRIYMPDPLGATCEGGPEGAGNITLRRSGGVTVADARSASALANPSRRGALRLITKCLLTTHDRRVEKRLGDARSQPRTPGTRRRNLSEAEKITIANGVGETSVISYLYRMRCRSNYDDPGIYLHGDIETELYVEHYNDLLLVTDALVRCLCRVLRQRIVPAQLEAATEVLPQSARLW